MTRALRGARVTTDRDDLVSALLVSARAVVDADAAAKRAVDLGSRRRIHRGSLRAAAQRLDLAIAGLRDAVAALS